MATFTKRHFLALSAFFRQELSRTSLNDRHIVRDAALHCAWMLRDDNQAFDLVQFMRDVERENGANVVGGVDDRT